MLRKIRLTLAIVFFTLITLLFLDFTGSIHAWFGWMAKIQFLPALLALNVGVVVGLIVLTLLLGRVYCSVICPLGVMQDMVAWFSKKRKKNRYTYSPALSWLRYGVLAAFGIAMLAGVGSLAALLAPYSSYGRIASNLFAPVYQWGNNLLAYFAERADSYAFYETTVWIKSMPTFIIRTHVLQHHLPGGHPAGRLGQIFLVEAGHRHGQVCQLQPLRTQLQSLMHRHQESSDRLQPLRGLYGLHRQMS